MAADAEQLQALSSAGRQRKDALESECCSRGCGDETQERQRLDSCGPVEAIELSGDDGAIVKTIMSSQDAMTVNHTPLSHPKKRSPPKTLAAGALKRPGRFGYVLAD